jgi:glutathione synthase/RimK-type ligase-like ATP-grasp enzyme
MENARRSIVKIIREICLESGISCESFSYDWIFRLSKNDKTVYIFGYHFEKNSATSHLICADKCSTSDVLKLNQVPGVEHTFFMSPTNIKYVGVDGNWSKLCELLNQHGKLVCKANEGTGGNNVYLVSNQFELENAAYKIFSQSRGMAVCPFYEIESEFRVVILDKDIKLIYRKAIPYLVGDGSSTLQKLLAIYLQENVDCLLDINISKEDNLSVLGAGEKYYLHWKHNLGQGADPVIVQDRELIKSLSGLALNAAKAVNVHFASVDIIKTGDRYLVLEINSGVMMESFSQLNDNNYQISKNIYAEAIESMFR